jgi:uncharacterized protein involved in type VI secretion and phage assembly
MMKPPFYGKYRGVVTDTKDPLNIGRIRAQVPDITGMNETGWAMPCAPFGGKNMGFFALPQVKTGVWIEFEQGDPDSPIWSGCWWGSKEEIPQELQTEPAKKVLIRTEGGQSILLDDTEGKKMVIISTTGGQKILLDDADGGQVTISTNGGQKIVLKDADGDLTVSTAGGQQIALRAMTVKIDNGSAATIELSGPKVALNQSALEVM